VAAFVEGELAEDFAGGAVDDRDVEVVDQGDDAGSGVGAADADGVEASAVAQGDLAAGVDAVDADPVVALGGSGGDGGGLGQGVVEGCGDCSVR
jgi:hypothetical protein